ncbi:MAG: S-layer homology domain-containing protein [Armatimonadota bacterium]
MTSSRRDVLRWTLLGLAMPGAAARAEPLLPRELTRPAPAAGNAFEAHPESRLLLQVASYLDLGCGLPLGAALLGSYDGGWTRHQVAQVAQGMHDHLRRVVTSLQAGSKPGGVREKLLACSAEPGRLRAVLGWHRVLLDQSTPVLKLMKAEPDGRQQELAAWTARVERLAALARPHALASAEKPPSAFEDVPLVVAQDVGHPAYEIVNELGAAGIFTGYPDGTFAGRKTLTRYEFAVAMQRICAEMERYQTRLAELIRIEGAAPAAPSREYETALEEVLVHRAMKCWTRALVSEFHPELVMLGADLKRIEDSLSALDGLARSASGRV